MLDLFRQAQELQRHFERNHWRFCFIGGVALQRWGEPRLTVDIDVTLLAGFADEEPFVDDLLKQYAGRLTDTKDFALKNRVLLLKSPESIDIDIAFGALPFEELAVGRATNFEFVPGITLLTCSAEDLIVLKAFADRSRDWADIEGIIVRQGDKLDIEYIFQQLSPLCELKESPEILRKLSAQIHAISKSGL